MLCRILVPKVDPMAPFFNPDESIIAAMYVYVYPYNFLTLHIYINPIRCWLLVFLWSFGPLDWAGLALQK